MTIMSLLVAFLDGVVKIVVLDRRLTNTNVNSPLTRPLVELVE